MFPLLPGLLSDGEPAPLSHTRSFCSDGEMDLTSRVSSKRQGSSCTHKLSRPSLLLLLARTKVFSFKVGSADCSFRPIHSALHKPRIQEHGPDTTMDVFPTVWE